MINSSTILIGAGFIAFGTACFFSTPASASSLSLSYAQISQQYSYLQQSTRFKPSGPALALSLDLNPQWRIDFDYQQLDDQLESSNLFTAQSDLNSWGASVGYSQNSWYYGLSYSGSREEISAASINRPELRNHWERTEANALGITLGYSWLSGNLFYNVGLSGQISRWDNDSKDVVPRQAPTPPSGGNGEQNQPPQVDRINSLSDGDSTRINASFSVARYWDLNAEHGLLLGAIFSWDHLLSGASTVVSGSGQRSPPNRSTPPRNNGQGSGGNFNRATGALLNSTATEDSFGRLSFYASYDLSKSLSIDIDTGFDIGTDSNGQSWSLSLGYFF